MELSTPKWAVPVDWEPRKSNLTISYRLPTTMRDGHTILTVHLLDIRVHPLPRSVMLILHSRLPQMVLANWNIREVPTYNQIYYPQGTVPMYSNFGPPTKRTFDSSREKWNNNINIQVEILTGILERYNYLLIKVDEHLEQSTKVQAVQWIRNDTKAEKMTLHAKKHRKLWIISETRRCTGRKHNDRRKTRNGSPKNKEQIPFILGRVQCIRLISQRIFNHCRAAKQILEKYCIKAHWYIKWRPTSALHCSKTKTRVSASSCTTSSGLTLVDGYRLKRGTEQMHLLLDIHLNRPLTYRILLKSLDGQQTQLRQKRNRFPGYHLCSSPLRPYLEGTVFRLRINQDPFDWLNGRDKTRTLARWRLRFQKLDLRVEYLNAPKNGVTVETLQIKRPAVTNAKRQSMSPYPYLRNNDLHFISMDKVTQPSTTKQCSQSMTTWTQSRTTTHNSDETEKKPNPKVKNNC